MVEKVRVFPYPYLHLTTNRFSISTTLWGAVSPKTQRILCAGGITNYGYIATSGTASLICIVVNVT
jgi:hypothetical protein